MNQETFALPDLGEGLTEAEIVRWLVAEGDEVRVDQPVVEVETAKSVVEVPSPFAGRVARRHGEEGQTLPVGAPLLTVDVDHEDVARYREEERAGSGNVLVGSGTPAPETPARRRRPRRHPAAAPSAPRASSVPAAPATAPPRVVSPLVRRLAQEHGVDIRQVRGTGVNGAITRHDVELARSGGRGVVLAPDGHPPAAPVTPNGADPTTVDGPAPGHRVTTAVSGNGRAGQPQAAGNERRIPLSPLGKAAAANLARSRAEIPEATIWVDVDATALVELRNSARTPEDPGPGLIAYLAAFVVAALQDFPVFNGRFDPATQEIVTSTTVNLGLAVQGERGLVVPAVIGAEALSIAQLDRQIDDLAARARLGRVSAAELTAGTFTLNNYGGLGVDGSAAIINHPQVAILGVGRILDRPWVVQGEIRPRKITQLSFVFDHRVSDGGTAAGFLRAVADAIENPVKALARR